MLGLFGYYRAFIPKFAQLTNSVNAVRGEKTEFKWTQEREKDFKDLKTQFKIINGRNV